MQRMKSFPLNKIMRLSLLCLIVLVLSGSEAAKFHRFVVLFCSSIKTVLNWLLYLLKYLYLFDFNRVPLTKISSVRKTLKSVGTSVEIVRRRWGPSIGGKIVPVPELLDNYMDVCIYIYI